jgi:hypothetical protein
MDLRQGMRDHSFFFNHRGITMGDKSPKSKDKSRKQDVADKNQKATAAKAKMPMSAGKKTK